MKRETNRTRLEQAIPLETPFVLHIEVTSACNFKCKFCMNHDDALWKQLGLRRGFMERDVFEKIIEDCKSFPKKLKRIYFHHGGEPLLHRELVDFIRYAKDAQVADELVMFTNGALLTGELGTRLANSGLDYIQISVEGVSAEKYEEVTGCKIDYDRFLEGVAHLYHEKPASMTLHAKILDCGLSEEEKAKFYRDFSGISDESYIEHLMDFCPTDVMDTTLGYGPTTTQEGKSLVEKVVCTQPFYVSAVYWDGSVAGCSCGDWRHNLVMGDVREESFYDIWNGEKFRAFRRLQLSGERKKCLACSDCKGIMNQLDDIDPYRQELLNRLERPLG